MAKQFLGYSHLILELNFYYLPYRCKIGRGVGTSASVVGGSLTIAGGILTLTTAGAAAPLLIAGIATSSVGAATNIGTSIIEKAINSKQVKSTTHLLFSML